MKGLLSIFIICFLSSQMVAQEFSFEKSNSPYSSIAETGTRITPDTSWTELDSIISIPDSFSFLGNTYSSVFLESHGATTFYEQCGFSNFPPGPTLLAPFMFIVDRSVYASGSDSAISGIYIDTKQVFGKSTFIIEWDNVTLDGGGGYYDSLNYQIRLNNYDKSIEIHFGSSYIEYPSISFSPATGPIFAWNYNVKCFSIESKTLLLYGDEKDPADTILVNEPITSLEQHWLDNIPDSGVVYKFYIEPTGIEKGNTNLDLQLYPNPVKELLNISIENTKDLRVRIYDLQGQLLLRKEFEQPTQLNISALPAGLYIYRLEDEDGRMVSGKIVKE